ncbi:MAG: L-threonylcarbamoyladenylate synthase [bacterium]|nr:L-threonylcarbamoyladenylate synthase [bacterium]
MDKKPHIKETVRALNSGGVIIFPTETVYGLGCDATNPAALLKIYQLKNRELGKAFPILVKDFNMLADYAAFNSNQKKIMAAAKAPTTFVLKAKNLSPLVTQNHTAAFRISSHSWIKQLFRNFDRPLVATSVNFAGSKPLSDPRLYSDVFGEKAQLIEEVIFDGVNRRTKSSRIIDITRKEPKVIRE